MRECTYKHKYFSVCGVCFENSEDLRYNFLDYISNKHLAIKVEINKYKLVLYKL